MFVTDLAAREAFHLLVLREMGQRLAEPAFVLKGGVNLRLYFGSTRYSEDMDFDGDSSKRQELTRVVPAVLRSLELAERLRALGIRDLEGGERPHKDGDFTLRYKLRLVTRADLRLSTKIEVSFRDRALGDESAVEPVADHLARRYLRDEDGDLHVSHYRAAAAVRQKIAALAKRTIVQARDVFDLRVLVRSPDIRSAVSNIASGLSEDTLREAYQRVFAIDYGQYADQVLAFLDEEGRAAYEGEAKWDETQLLVADLIESTASQREDGGEA
jgi:predicted nucleotidyltransferase component of viral defense system